MRVAEAFDINTFVNRIYEWNFKQTPLSVRDDATQSPQVLIASLQKNLERITAAMLDR